MARLASGRSLASVAEAVGISSSALSQIETGAMQPSVNRLIELVGEIGVTVSAVLDERDEVEPRAIASGEQADIPGVHVASSGHPDARTLGQGVEYRRLMPMTPEGIDYFESVYPPGTSSSIDGAMLSHSGYETGRVVSGILQFEFTEGTLELGPGDSLSFWATRPHRVVNASDAPAVALWLTLHTLREDESPGV